MAALPKDWRRDTTAGLLSAIALARVAVLTLVDGLVGGARMTTRGAELMQVRAELARVTRERQLLEARLARVAPRKRPHFSASERLEILALRAASGWSVAETARRFLVTPETVASWFHDRDRADRERPSVGGAPVNRFPDQVRGVVHALKTTFPFLGARKIAEVLARAGLRLAATTARRMLKERPVAPPNPSRTRKARHSPVRVEARAPHPREDGRAVTARTTHHIWHADFTFVPRGWSSWVPWGGFALPQQWPFGWWVGAVMDQHSRAVLRVARWRNQPTWEDARGLFEGAIDAAGRAPGYVITDRGGQFQAAYRRWCDALGIRPRQGAAHRHGSIAVIERFWGSLKRECLRRMTVPVSAARFAEELRAYVEWYNLHRPHRALGGRTPDEVRCRRKSALETRGLEPRAQMPVAGTGARRVRHLELVVEQRLGSARLPVIQLRSAA